MANRSMLFAARKLPERTGEPVKVLGLGEFGWDIPALYKVLVSADPRACRSVVFGHESSLAIAGDRQGGLERLRTIRTRLKPGAPGIAGLDEAIEALSKAHIDHPYFLLEPGEILELGKGPLDKELATLLAEIKAIRIDDIVALAQESGEARHWANGSWSSILYFEPEGSERPPIDPKEHFLTTTAQHLLAHRAILPECKALNAISLELDDTPDGFAKALAALKELPGPFDLTVYGSCAELPSGIEALANLRKLGIGNMGLRSLPGGLAHLPRLTGLYLQQNKFDRLPECLRRMPQLTELSVGSMPLGELPEWIAELKSLETLYAGGCELRRLPAALWSLRNLRDLNLLSNPGLTQLPDGIEALSALRLLNVANCGLTQLPDGVAKLPALKELWIAGNKLTALPEGVGRMPLDVLSMGGNPMRRPGWFSFAPRFRAKKVYWD